MYTFASDVTVKSEIAPLATVTSSAVNPVGASEKVKVTTAVSLALRAVSDRFIDTVGGTVSTLKLFSEDFELMLPAASDCVAVKNFVPSPKFEISEEEIVSDQFPSPSTVAKLLPSVLTKSSENLTSTIAAGSPVPPITIPDEAVISAALTYKLSSPIIPETEDTTGADGGLLSTI